MTKEPIMIDDVDVSGCGELVKQDENTLICITGYLCKDRQNCYYKQLKRKEQESRLLQAEKAVIRNYLGCDKNQTILEKLEQQPVLLPSYYKERYEEIKQMNNDIAKKCFNLEKENKQYRPIIDRLLKQFETYDKLKSLDVVTFAKQTFEQLDQLKAEIKELKHKNARKRTGLKKKQSLITQLKAEKEELEQELNNLEEQKTLEHNFIDSFLNATKNSEWLNKSILEDEADAIIEKVESDYVQLENYKQALQKIKEIVQKRLSLVCKDCVLKQCKTCEAKQILQKCEVIDD